VYRHGDAFSREHWLAHCEGFRVETATGLLGYVEAVEPDAGGDLAALLVRRCRDLAALTIPRERVADVVAPAETVRLR
jgi:hypothetical protein